MLRQGNYEVRRLKRRQDNLLQNKLAKFFTRLDKKKFYSEIRWLNHTHPRSIPCVDDISGSTNIPTYNLPRNLKEFLTEILILMLFKPPAIHRSSRLPLTHL